MLQEYIPPKTVFSVLCARLSLSQSAVAEFVPCRMDTVKKWQQGKKEVPPEIIAHLYNLENSLSVAADVVVENIESLLDKDGVLRLEVPQSIGVIFEGLVDVGGIIRSYFALVSQRLLGRFPVELVQSDLSLCQDSLDAGSFKALRFLVNSYDDTFYSSLVNPETQSSEKGRVIPLENWRDLQHRIKNFETVEWSSIGIHDVIVPASNGVPLATDDIPPTDWISCYGPCLEWVAPDGQTLAVDMTVYPSVDALDTTKTGIELIERRTVNTGVVLRFANADIDAGEDQLLIALMAELHVTNCIYNRLGLQS